MHHEKKLNMAFFVLNVMNMLHEKENLVSDKEESDMWYCTVIKDLMKQWKDEAGVRAIILYNMKQEKNEYDDSEYTLEICTNRPGPLIGMMGTRVDKYRDLISEKIKHRVFVKFIETVEIV